MREPSNLATGTMARFPPQRGNSRGRRFIPAQVFDGLAKGAVEIMFRRTWLVLVLLIGISSQPASAQGLLGGLLSNIGSTLSNLTSPQPGVIVRTNQGLSSLKLTCLLHGCT